jgi:hypothetical protein
VGRWRRRCPAAPAARSQHPALTLTLTLSRVHVEARQGTPPGSLHGAAETQLHCVAPFTAATHPLSALNDPLVHTGHTTVAVREQVGVGLQHVSPRWSTALGRGTYGDCVVGQDVQGLLRTLHRQVRRMLAGRAASPNPDGRFDTLHNRYTASTEQRRDTLECNRCSWCARVSVQ